MPKHILDGEQLTNNDCKDDLQLNRTEMKKVKGSWRKHAGEVEDKGSLFLIFTKTEDKDSTLKNTGTYCIHRSGEEQKRISCSCSYYCLL